MIEDEWLVFNYRYLGNIWGKIFYIKLIFKVVVKVKIVRFWENFFFNYKNNVKKWKIKFNIINLEGWNLYKRIF